MKSTAGWAEPTSLNLQRKREKTQ